jgi:membrane-associated phospholipid phosphatase
VILVIGLAVAGPLATVLQAEDAVNAGLVVHRNATWDLISFVMSYLGSTEMVVGVCLLVGGLVLWRTRDWRLAVVPAIAIMVQLSIYLGVIAFIRRERPSVERLDVLLPMSSYPSGHVGASTALYLTFLLIAMGIERVGLRWATIVVCVTIPLLVAFGRLYRGMHHLTDIAAGFLVGVACGLLAYGWYRHRARTTDMPERREPADLPPRGQP